MARRSARLQKRSPTPSESSDRTSGSENASTQLSPKPERLQSVVEDDEPAIKTPKRPAGAGAGTGAQSASKLPQMKNTPTPHKGVASLLSSVTARTPKNRTPIKPAGEEMHPAHHHASTAKPLDEARWLGFQALGAYTAPPKATNIGVGQETPTKTPVLASHNKMKDATRSPNFTFRFTKSPSASNSNSEMSPNTRSIIKAVNTAVTGGRSLFGADEFTAKADIIQKRKTVVPKGKMTRFSDVHMAEFKKMDSIANHASAFRADPGRFKVVDKSAKKSPSKADLTTGESSAKAPNKLKRTQSKMDMASPGSKSLVTLKRTQSKMDVTETGPRLLPTPLKRAQSKMDMSKDSNLPRAQSTVRLVPPTRDGPPSSHEDNPTAKRFKRTAADDAATTRHVSREVSVPATPAKPARKITSQTALPRLASRLMSPTKASLARTQSAKAIKTTSMIPPVFRSPSTNPFSPTNIGNTIKEGVHESIRKTSNSLQRIRSILRTPSRKFSNDPAQIAAGTHMSPPPGLDLSRPLPVPPATAPVKKHVNFTNSTLERATQDDLGKSPSPMKLRAGSEIPSGAVIYPAIQSGVEYPELPKSDESPAPSPSRRLTFGDTTTVVTMPGTFSFESDKPIDFGPSSAGTIRMVRKSNASSLVDGKKRKHESVEESSDKENSEPAHQESRSPFKRMKPTPSAPPKTPTSVSKLPRRTPQRIGSISKSRLAFLATPKRGKV